MPTFPSDPGLPPAVALESLVAEYGDRWDFEHASIAVVVAVRKSADGRHIRVLAGSPAELLEKLRTADVVEP